MSPYTSHLCPKFIQGSGGVPQSISLFLKPLLQGTRERTLPNGHGIALSESMRSVPLVDDSTPVAPIVLAV